MGKAAKTLIVILIIGIGAFFAADHLEDMHQKRLDQALEVERSKRAEEVQDLQQRIADLEKEVARQLPPPVPEEKISEVFGEPEPKPVPQPQETSCQALEQRIEAFFTYIDKQAYMAPFELKQSAYDLFRLAMADLSSNLPLVSGEMKDPMSLMRNVAHFYRVLGEKRVKMAVTVIQNESDIIETAMANFFAWFSQCHRCEAVQAPCPTLEALYQYAGFFLNTLAGRSYLLRRPSPVRSLTTYYAILIMDRASDQHINPHGIDIRPYIDASLDDMENQRFIYRKEYMNKLDALKTKYKM